MQLTGYIKKATPVRRESTSPEGYQEVTTTYVPRGLEPVSSEIWTKDASFLVKILDPRVGKKVYVSQNGMERRDLYFAGVETKGYSWFKFGSLCSKTKIDAETQEPETIWWIWVGGRDVPVTPRQAAAIAPLSDADAEKVSEDVENV